MQEITDKIISNPLFLKLKNVTENNPWHDHESVYDHLLKTYKIAQKGITGDFITNSEAKKLFLDFAGEDINGIKRKELILITALIHDIGKILYFRENGEEKPLRHESDGTTKMPGHEYWGSTIVPDLLKDTNLPYDCIELIKKVVRLHDTFNDSYFNNIAGWDMDDVIDDVKSRAEGLYKECLFNIYCDVNTAESSKNSIKRIIELFNQPSLYSPREYFIK